MNLSMMTPRLGLAVALSMTAGPLMAQSAAQPPNKEVSLVGTWSGIRERMARTDGYRSGEATLVITEQQGRAFKGYLSRANKDGDVKEDLWGAFTPNGHLIVGSDEEGFYWFTLVNADTLDYCYSETGAAARTTCARLIRNKT